MSKKTKAAKKNKENQKPKKTFMQWATAGPAAYMVIGAISFFAGIYGIAKPETFNSEGTATYVVTIIVFFVLGVVLMVQGYRIHTGKAEMPKFRFFSNK